MEKKLPSDPQKPVNASGVKSSGVSLPVKSLSLSEKLKAFDPAEHGGEYLTAEPVGLEVIPR